MAFLRGRFVKCTRNIRVGFCIEAFEGSVLSSHNVHVFREFIFLDGESAHLTRQHRKVGLFGRYFYYEPLRVPSHHYSYDKDLLCEHPNVQNFGSPVMRDFYPAKWFPSSAYLTPHVSHVSPQRHSNNAQKEVRRKFGANSNDSMASDTVSCYGVFTILKAASDAVEWQDQSGFLQDISDDDYDRNMDIPVIVSEDKQLNSPVFPVFMEMSNPNERYSRKIGVKDSALTDWERIASWRVLAHASGTFLPMHPNPTVNRLAVTAAREAAASGKSKRQISAAALAAIDHSKHNIATESQETRHMAPKSYPCLGGLSKNLKSLMSNQSSGSLWDDVQAALVQLNDGETSNECRNSGLDFGGDVNDDHIDISVEPRFIPETWTDVSRPYYNSTVVSTLSTSHLSKPYVDTSHDALRNLLALQYISPMERKRQEFWDHLLQFSSRTLDRRLAIGNVMRKTTGTTAIPFAVPVWAYDEMNRLWNNLKLLQTIGWKACSSLHTPHSRLEAWRFGPELRCMYASKFDDRVSVQRIVTPEELDPILMEEADAVLVIRDGVVDLNLSRGNKMLLQVPVSSSDSGNVAHNEKRSAHPHIPFQEDHGDEQNYASSSDHSSTSGCGFCSSATQISNGRRRSSIRANEIEEVREGSYFIENLREKDDECVSTVDNESSKENIPAVMGSFLMMSDPDARAAVENELRFVPELTNYWRKNTQPFHRGQIGRMSRKYDSDFSIYDYRKLDFGMAKLSAANLAGMLDAAVVIVNDFDFGKNCLVQNKEEKSIWKNSDDLGQGQNVSASRTDNAAADHLTSGENSPEKSGKEKKVPKGVVKLQVIFLSSTDEVDGLKSAETSPVQSGATLVPASLKANHFETRKIKKQNENNEGFDRNSGSCVSKASENDPLSERGNSMAPANPLTHPRLVVMIGNGAKCLLQQTHASVSSLLNKKENEMLKRRQMQARNTADGKLALQKNCMTGLVNAATRVVLEEGAELYHVYAQELDQHFSHFENLSVEVRSGASYTLTHVDLGARISRFALQVEGCKNSTHISKGLSILNEKQSHSKYEMFLHTKERAKTHQVHRSLVGGDACAIWRSRIRIERDGVGAWASSLNRVVLLNDGAKCIAVPTLEIIPDDIEKATHGASIRDFDQEPMFYLSARGVDPELARTLLMTAFAEEPLELVNDGKLRSRVLAKVATLSSSQPGTKRHHMFRGGDGGA